ncbi:hypothetical protein I4F81_008547 [Pyropia yezoensis]|uniref:Uncharacterized protein n=1 Tax=Pyropia yezoensis TaxID=2788 RepID=A0ACC3C775_PYRYE|nr:hypothetical protein I4F81_008547 [Neopyropia yezoensis]
MAGTVWIGGDRDVVWQRHPLRGTRRRLWALTGGRAVWQGMGPAAVRRRRRHWRRWWSLPPYAWGQSSTSAPVAAQAAAAPPPPPVSPRATAEPQAAEALPPRRAETTAERISVGGTATGFVVASSAVAMAAPAVQPRWPHTGSWARLDLLEEWAASSPPPNPLAGFFLAGRE